MGLKIVVQQQITPIVIETDWKEIIGMFQTNTMHYTNIINDCMLLLLQLDRPPIQHIYRKQNCVADSLVKYGVMHAQDNCILFAHHIFLPHLFTSKITKEHYRGGSLISTIKEARKGTTKRSKKRKKDKKDLKAKECGWFFWKRTRGQQKRGKDRKENEKNGKGDGKEEAKRIKKRVCCSFFEGDRKQKEKKTKKDGLLLRIT